MSIKCRSIRKALKGEQSPGLDRVQVKTFNDTGEPETYQWAITKEDVHSALQIVNPARFRGHAPAPFGHGDRLQDIGLDCMSPSVQDILNGVYHFRLEELTPEQQEWINQLRRIDTHAAQQNAKVDLNIDTEDFVSAWSKFRESTASSPSGRHYGHYKAAAVAAI
jgi:hypothetical protein